jgi:hypothetical protein
MVHPSRVRDSGAGERVTGEPYDSYIVPERNDDKTGADASGDEA